MCAGQVCHCVAFIEGNYYVRTDGTVIDAKDPTPYRVIKDMATGALLDGVRDLVEGSDHACALRTDNTVWCWARSLNGNQRGQLGNGTFSVESPRLARQVQITGSTSSAPLFLTDVRSLAHSGMGNASQSACVVKNDGTVWCWGRNEETYLFPNQNQQPSTTEDLYPLAVQIWASPNTVLSGVDQLSIGAGHACFLRSGAVYCWGRNYNGAVGVGDTNPRVYATAVTGLPANVTKVRVSFQFSCALAGGQLYCWGYDPQGQLGDLGSVTKETGCDPRCRLAPGPGKVAVDGQTGVISDIKDFVLGESFTVVIRSSDNSIRFFGDGFPTAPAPTDLVGGANNLWQVTAWGSYFPEAVRYITRDAKYFIGPTMRYPVCQ
jgi:alpha-tubulin suppressor-like RCC1 family protein